MATEAGEFRSGRSVQWVLRRSAVAIVGAVVANGFVLRTGAPHAILPPVYATDAVGPVAVPATAAALAAVLYACLDGRVDHPHATFRRLIGVGLVLSLVPVAIAAAASTVDPVGLVVLVTMHAAVATVVALAFLPFEGDR